MKTLTAFIEYDDNTNLYVGLIPGLTGVHTQAASLDELNRNLKEVLELCMEENPDLLKDKENFKNNENESDFFRRTRLRKRHTG